MADEKESTSNLASMPRRLSRWLWYLPGAALILAGLILIIVSATRHHHDTVQQPVVMNGTNITGTSGASGTEFFGGIPYAQAPVGSLRFAPPVLLNSLPTSLDARQFGPECPQPGSSSYSEDCLTLNIFRPSGINSSTKLPVMVWVFGGGFSTGSGGAYVGTGIVSRSIKRGTPVIYVSLNYRLGALGFPTGTEAQAAGSLNLGLKDQLTALKWVNANIQTFGGDPGKVTLFGESAGSISISLLHLNSNLESLVRGVIFESGSPTSGGSVPPDQGDPTWAQLVSMISACASAQQGSTFDCLRQAPVEDIVNASENVSGGHFGFTPVLDGENGVIPDSPTTLLLEGKFSKIPFIGGTNLDEGTLFVPSAVNSPQAVTAFLESTVFNATPSEEQDYIQTMLALYPSDAASGSPFGTGDNTFGLSASWKQASAMQGDILFQSARRFWTNVTVSRGVKAFAYLFTDPQPNVLAPGVTHSTELPYVFNIPELEFSPAAQGIKTLSPIMMDYWISFVATLDPNDGRGSARPKWPQYTADNQMLMQLNSQNLTVIQDNYRSVAINYINSIPKILGH